MIALSAALSIVDLAKSSFSQSESESYLTASGPLAVLATTFTASGWNWGVAGRNRWSDAFLSRAKGLMITR
jgi:hypothetical protein